MMPAALPFYNPIINSLNADGWKTSEFTYDWRKRVSENGALLKTFIDSLVKNGEKVDVVAHSMGGLVARSYIEQETINNKIDKLITVGTPNQGSVDAYPTWSAGQIISDDVLWKFYVTMIGKRCAFNTAHNDRLVVQQYIPSIQDTLPIFDYLIDSQTNKYIPIGSMSSKNTWLLSSKFKTPFFGITVGTLSGTNETTSLAYQIGQRSSDDQALGNWEDGKPLQTITTKEGDNKVLSMSSSLPGADNQTITGTHTDIISSNAGVQKILDFLENPNQIAPMMAMQNISDQQNPKSLKEPKLPRISKYHFEPVVEPKSGLFIVGYPARFWIIEPKGKLLKDADGLISIMDPKSGDYKLIFWPKEKESHLIVAQILENNKNFYKDYAFTTRFPNFWIPQIHFLKFNAEHPKEDILH